MLTKQHLPVLGDTVIAVPPKGGHVPLPQVEPTKRVFPIEHKTVTPKFNAGHSKIPANNRHFSKIPAKFYGDFRLAYKESC